MTGPDEQLSPELRALLDAEKAAPNPSPEVMSRVWTGVEQGIGGATGAAAASATKPLAAAWSKWLAVSAVVVAGGVGVFGVARGTSDTIVQESPAGEAVETAVQRAEVMPEQPELERAPANVAAPGVKEVMPDQPAPAERPEIRAESEEHAEVIANANGAVRQPLPAREERLKTPEKSAALARDPDESAKKLAAKVASDHAPPSQPSAGRLKAELTILGAARAAHIAGDTARALRQLDAHRAQFAEGQLVEERMALRVQVLAAAGQVNQAKAELRAFRTRFATSVMTAAIERAVQQAANSKTDGDVEVPGSAQR